MRSFLPPLRALQAFEAFGRLGSVAAAAQDLGVTPGAISQQVKALERHLGRPLLTRDGRRATLTAEARTYHEMIGDAFDRLRNAQTYIEQQDTGRELRISGLPTLLLKWLNPQLHSFQALAPDVPIRLDATHDEPDARMTGAMFRLTYGAVSGRFPHARALFTDHCFPVCSPDFLTRNPTTKTVQGLADLPLIEIDWGPAYAGVPRWRDWFAQQGIAADPRPAAVHSLSSSALEAAAGGQGVALAQRSFAAFDLERGRLVRLSQDALPMPEPYFICWGKGALDDPNAHAFLNWVLSVARPMLETG